MVRRLRPVELDFIASAPVRHHYAAGLAAPAADVFHALAKDTAGWPDWFGAVASARPVEAGRQVALVGGIRFTETVLARDPDERYAYRVDTVNVPGLTAMAEEWLLTALPSGGTRLRWTFAADGPAAVRVLLHAGRAAMGRSFHQAARALDARLTGRMTA
ncbi:SRPBCC family protein [Streptantibioticus parmotrematis]|uniref:SRPBCC family protein n=1 Tax=Streptantibioticus parmotrematis TaxID=2873249 RepID=UPI00340E71DC